jgi:hypothetical protein
MTKQSHASNSHRLRERGDVVYELHHDTLDEVYRIRRVEVLAVCESREAARQWMLDHQDERKRAVSDV